MFVSSLILSDEDIKKFIRESGVPTLMTDNGEPTRETIEILKYIIQSEFRNQISFHLMVTYEEENQDMIMSILRAYDKG